MNITHGMSATRIYQIYRGIRGRCYNKKNKDYPWYGGKGVKVLWRNFESFYKDMNHSFREGLTIERINHSGHYSKKNCCWATRKDQANNRTNNHTLYFKGKSMTLAQWASFLGINRRTIISRAWRKLPIEKILAKKLLRKPHANNTK